jgi:hypothetical protein
MNTETIKQTGRAKYLHSLAKLTAKENHTAQLLITAHGGTFRVTPELITFLSIDQLGATTVVLDIFENPIEVDRASLLKDAITLYNRVMQSWLATVTEINKKR